MALWERKLAARISQAGVAGLLCVLILCSFVVAGFWPFGPVYNDVTWIADQPGFRYGEHGIILSAGPLSANGSGDCSIKMWVRPAGSGQSSTLLAFYALSGGTGVSLHRSLSDLRLDRETGGGKPVKHFAGKILHDGMLAFVSVVSGPRGTAVYLDGTLIRVLPQVRTIPGDCSGSFAVAHSSRGHHRWQGEIHGLAIYNQELTPGQVRANWQSWRKAGRPDNSTGGQPVVLYLFSEGGGKVVPDHGAAGVNLTIPDRYRPVQRTWLLSPFSATDLGWVYAGDVLINIIGFVPFGFALSAFLASTGRVRRVGAWAVIGGALVSLCIESLQPICQPGPRISPKW